MQAGFKNRLRVELDDLERRLVGLEHFLETEAYKQLPRPERMRLQDQCCCMQDYRDVLRERAEALGVR